MPDSTTKLVSLTEAALLASQARALGKTVVLGNGAFDMLHVGHTRYLSAAKTHGDLLIVAVNSDASVRKSKGPLRPLVPQDERVELLAHIDCVDVIVLFDEPTVTEVLRTIRPEIHAKGTDYTLQTVPERAVIAEWGGRTVICGDAKEHATTDIVAEILRRFANQNSG